MTMRKNQKYWFVFISTVMILLTVSMFMFSGCTGTWYKVDYCGEKDCYSNAKDSYMAGTKVVLYYEAMATDTEYSFYLDGESINFDYDNDKGCIISFTMPEHDVKLECKTYSNYF